MVKKNYYLKHFFFLHNKKKQINIIPKIKLNQLKKIPLTQFDKIIFFYNLKNRTSLYTYRTFAIFEIQLNSVVIHANLVPYIYIVPHLCFYNLITVNSKVEHNPYYILSLYDRINIPPFLYSQIYNQSLQFKQKFSVKFLKKFLYFYYNLILNSIKLKKQFWLLSTIKTSYILGQTIIFKYPDIKFLYSIPFQRFTNLYMRPAPFNPRYYRSRHFKNSNSILKLKLFEYINYYRL